MYHGCSADLFSKFRGYCFQPEEAQKGSQLADAPIFFGCTMSSVMFPSWQACLLQSSVPLSPCELAQGGTGTPCQNEQQLFPQKPPPRYSIYKGRPFAREVVQIPTRCARSARVVHVLHLIPCAMRCGTATTRFNLLLVLQQPSMSLQGFLRSKRHRNVNGYGPVFGLDFFLLNKSCRFWAVLGLLGGIAPRDHAVGRQTALH